MAYRTVMFDCDSTLVAVEGVDELAARAGAGARLARLTTAAMEGRVPLEQVYGARLDEIRPDRQALEWLARRYLDTLVEGAAEVVAALTALGARVHVLSGGLRPGVSAVASRLGIPEERVHAVGVRLTADGAYDGYDTESPLARAGGKADVGREIVARDGRPSAIVGDGVTDLELQEVCDLFVGFGGVARREEVARRADVYVERRDLYGVLRALTSEDERRELARRGHGDAVARASD